MIISVKPRSLYQFRGISSARFGKAPQAAAVDTVKGHV